MKNINDVCVIIQARLSSERIPNKMTKSFGDSSLFEIACKKLLESNVIPKDNIYVSVHEKELVDIANKCDINIFKRSKESAIFDGDGSVSMMYDWWDKLPFKYVVLVSACLPFLKIETVDDFFKGYLDTNKNGMFAVFGKNTYYWNSNKKLITTKFEESGNMNTKIVETTYEAAHCLYAGKMEFIGDGIWMGDFTKNEIELFTIDEKECFDIDYRWQFEMAEILYKKQIG
jgi:CMP-N-acetylneuraminic acid synthetase